MLEEEYLFWQHIVVEYEQYFLGVTAALEVEAPHFPRGVMMMLYCGFVPFSMQPLDVLQVFYKTL